MRTLLLALYAEGPSDNRFLPPIIQRTTEKIIAHYGDIDVLEPIIIPKQQGKREKCILNAAKDACNCNALIVHSDADAKTPDRADQERIQPGFNLVLQSTENVCKNLIPIIPVQMIEAWMLADHSTLRETIGTDMSPQNLGFPSKAALVELDANPKHTLNEIIRKANANRSHRRQKMDFNTRHELLARKIDLNILALVPSYQKFVISLTITLAKLHFIPFNTSEEEKASQAPY